MTRRTRRIALLALTSAAVILGGLWFSAARGRRANEVATGTITNERASLANAIRALEAQLATSGRSDRVADKTPAPGSAEPAAVRKDSAKPRPRTLSEIIATSPTLELLELDRQRAATRQEYDRFFRQLGLTPEQIARFCELQVRRAETRMDLQAAARLQGIDAGKAAAELQARSAAEHEAALVALLGTEGYRRLVEFTGTIPVYNTVVRGLAGAAALCGVPLTAEQGDRLLAAALNASGATNPRGEVELRGIDWDAVDVEAQRILTPFQFALFRNVEPPSGFHGRWRHQLDAAIQHAIQSEHAAANTGSPQTRNSSDTPR